jgi:anaerobic ribonucleoside-triphosphate reductase activating protein
MQSWDMAGGSEMSVSEIVEAVERAGFSGVTFSGGDPLYQIDELTRLACILKEQGYDLWCYTGFLWESLVSDDRYSLLLNTVDVLVDGPFVQSLRDTGLVFRGSSNQRLILSSLSSGNELQLYEPDTAPAF